MNKVIKKENGIWLITGSLADYIEIDYSEYNSLQELYSMLHSVLGYLGHNDLVVGFDPYNENKGIEVTNKKYTSLEQNAILLEVLPLFQV